MSASYAQTARTTPSRHAERAAYDEATVHDVLDSAVIGHLAYVADERPRLLPMLFVRMGHTVFLHASTGAHPARLTARRGGLAAVFETTIVDGLVLARSAFSHSANYRSVVAHGDLSLVTEPERKDEVLRALLDKLVPGRAADARPHRAGGDHRQPGRAAVAPLRLGADARAAGRGDPGRAGLRRAAPGLRGGSSGRAGRVRRVSPTRGSG